MTVGFVENGPGHMLGARGWAIEQRSGRL